VSPIKRKNIGPTRGSCVRSGLPQAPEHRPINQHHPRAQGQGLEHVGAAPNAAVYTHFGLARHGLHHLGQRFDDGQRAVLVSPFTMYRYDASMVACSPYLPSSSSSALASWRSAVSKPSVNQS
jgi:hypothetical protein